MSDIYSLLEPDTKRAAVKACGRKVNWNTSDFFIEEGLKEALDILMPEIREQIIMEVVRTIVADYDYALDNGDLSAQYLEDAAHYIERVML